MAYLRHRAQQELTKHIHETIPAEYQKANTAIDQVLRMCWTIVGKTVDEKTKLQALALINDCSKYKVDLATNGVVITDAIKYVNQKSEQLDTLKSDLNNTKNKLNNFNLDEDEDESENETETETNGVF
jgi:hypothetical protein